MRFKKALLICLLSFSVFMNNDTIFAAPPENELNQYLAEIGWTKQDLMDYLDYYEIPLEEFSTVAELQFILGTPINAANLQEVLSKYNLTEAELNELMDHFGDSLNDYTFIEDVDAAVDFYVNHDEYMAGVENELAKIGLTEEEVEKFFTYLTEVEEKNENQLDQMEGIDTRLESFLYVDDTSQLSDEEIDELVQIMEESIALYEIKFKFSLDNKDISLNELLKMKEIPSTLYASIYSTAGELLIDFALPPEYFVTAEVIDEGEEMVHVGELSDDFVDHMHEEKYDEIHGGLK
ncbi:processed acidic surface protein [Bacillus sp. HMF5848]|uniref:processed acidic surface protein n=1 Tax=Bacillus sp. HMF5848 TaxID=2495421 RepID=UPI0016399B0A|nr:processed acidic surface protein [Bacillus sp. HMF5848]